MCWCCSWNNCLWNTFGNMISQNHECMYTHVNRNTHQVIVKVVHGAGQHGSLHGRALEHTFDFAADSADPERFPSFWQVSTVNREICWYIKSTWPALILNYSETIPSTSTLFFLFFPLLFLFVIIMVKYSQVCERTSVMQQTCRRATSLFQPATAWGHWKVISNVQAGKITF